jgi:hypothetical protein
MDVKDIDLSGAGYEPVGFCEHGNESFDSMKCRKFCGS